MITLRSPCWNRVRAILCFELGIYLEKKKKTFCVLTLQVHQTFKCVPLIVVPIVDRFFEVTKL